MLVKTKVVKLVGGNRMGTITIDNPTHNMISSAVLKELGTAFDAFTVDPWVQAILLTAVPQERKGKTFFSSGADVAMLAGLANGSPIEARKVLDDFMELGLKLDRSPKPFIGFLDGIAWGLALELLLTCDRIYATPRSSVAFKEINHRIFPGGGGTQRAPRRMQHALFALAFRMIVSGEDVDAQTALNYGLIDGVGPAEDIPRVMAEICMAPHWALRTESQGMSTFLRVPHEIDKFAKGHSKVAIQLAWEAMFKGNQLPLEEGLRIERNRFLDCLEGEEAKRTLAAFVGGEKPEFPPETLY